MREHPAMIPSATRSAAVGDVAEPLLGVSPAIRAIELEIEFAARSDSKVLITGESGVGKEVIARLIHRSSRRALTPLVTVNCAGIPDSLLESALFGHMRGSFTGAYRDHLGLLEMAHGSTIFLDEIGEMSLRMQALLLRFLENGEIQRVGSQRTQTRVDVRVIAATNRNLLERMTSKDFREDLFYRLNVVHVNIPPLRARREDIPAFLQYFLHVYAERHGVPVPELATDALARLVAYDWPGNVRELRNLIESMVVLAPDHEINVNDLPRHIREGGAARLLPVHIGPLVRGQEQATGRELEFIVRSLLELKLQVEELRRRVGESPVASPQVAAPVDGRWIGDIEPPIALGPGYNPPVVRAIEPRDQPPPPNVVTVAPGMKMAEIERAVIEAALKETRGNRRRAADLLGIGERTLYRKIKEYRMPEELYSAG